MITIDIEQAFVLRGKVYYPGYLDGYLVYVFVAHDFDYASTRCLDMGRRGLIPILTEKTSMAELEEAVSRKGFWRAIWSDLWGKGGK